VRVVRCQAEGDGPATCRVPHLGGHLHQRGDDQQKHGQREACARGQREDEAGQQEAEAGAAGGAGGSGERVGAPGGAHLEEHHRPVIPTLVIERR
jgi:hypothetical protein